MLISLREYNSNINVSDILVSRDNEGKDENDGYANRYLVTRIEPKIEIARIKLTKENLYILAEQSLEYDSMAAFQNGKWYIDIS